MPSIGKYQLLVEIGQGRFGDVYRAIDTALEREVALKILKPEWAGDVLFVQQFLREAKTAAKIEDPNVVGVFDVGESDGRYFIAMQYLPGGSLQDRLEELKERDETLGVEEALRIGLEIAEGLAALHKRDLVHCDLKPSNILFDADGHARVGDLGLALSFNTSRSSLSGEGPRHSPGTPAYMSPEQEANAPHLRPPADVYALGLILFEMLSGRSYKNQEPGTKLSDLRKDTPAWLDELLGGLLAKDYEQRIWNGEKAAEAIRAGLAKIREQTQTQTTTRRKPEAEQPRDHEKKPPIQPEPEIVKNNSEQRETKKILRVGLAIVAVMALLIWGISRGTQPEPTPTAQPAEPTAAALLAVPTQAPATQVSGKGKIGLSFSDFATERWKNEEIQMRTLLEAKGYEVVSQEANHDVELQNDQIDNMVGQGVKALIVIAEDGDAIVPSVNKAADAGVKVIAYDCLIMSPKIAAYISFSNVEVGRQQALGIMKAVDIENWDVDGKGKLRLVELGGSPNDNSAILFRKGQNEVLYQYMDKIDVVADQWVDNWDDTEARVMMENILTAHANRVDAVVASNDGTALGALQALKAQGLAGIVPISGQDATADGCNSIVKGELTVTILKDIRNLAPQAVNLTDSLLNGKAVTGLEQFTLAELTNDNTRTGDVQALFLPVTQVTKDNVYDLVVKSGFRSYDDVYRDIPDAQKPPRP
jgi:D-xylose transport system substrate-binding protein